MKVSIEFIAAPGCEKCAGKQGELHDVAISLFGQDNVVWRDVNVLEELDHVVALGVLSMPAIAVNGDLCFSSLPTPEQFRAALARQGSC